MQNPSKQGLKLIYIYTYIIIDTTVAMQNPSKQGLKQCAYLSDILRSLSRNAKSIKTRIETCWDK